jgi:hypothetical protein
MSECLRLHSNILRKIVKARPKQRKKIINLANKELVRCLLECTQNTLQGNVLLTTSQAKKLKPYKRQLRRLVHKKESWLNKRKKINQKVVFYFRFSSQSLALFYLNSLQKKKKNERRKKVFIDTARYGF